jgi:tetratricopeptide (TPR) repeat protein
VGRRAPYRLLEAVAPEPDQLALGLAALRRAELLVDEKARDEVTWTFVHALAHETVYESMLQRARQQLHLQVATAIERLFADRLTDFHGPLAFHYTRGEQLDKAEEYLLKAGEDAARTAASEEALALFREASRVFMARYGDGGDPRKKGRLEKNIGLALLSRGDLSESIAHFDRALEHFGEHVPKTAALSYLSFAADFVAVLGQLYVGLKVPRTVTDWDREREVWQVLFNRGRAEITSDPIRLFFDTIAGFRQLNRIDASRIDQAGALYASCASVFCYSGISFAVGRRALAVAKRLARPDSVQDRFTGAVMDFTVATSRAAGRRRRSYPTSCSTRRCGTDSSGTRKRTSGSAATSCSAPATSPARRRRSTDWPCYVTSTGTRSPAATTTACTP